MNFFKLIDDVFTGVVFFVYNVVYSMLTLIVHPINGGLRLIRKQRHKRQNQVGSQTMLFVVWFLLLYASSQTFPSDKTDLKFILADVFNNGDIHVVSSALMPSVLGAFVGTAVLDATLRFIVWVIVAGRHPYRRAIVVSIAEFAACTSPLVLLPLLFIPVNLDISEIDGDARYLVMYILPAFALTAILPRNKNRWLFPKIPRWIKRVCLTAVGATLIFLVGVVGAKISEWAQKPVPIPDHPIGNLVSNLKCEVINGHVEISGIITNRTGDAVIYYQDEMAFIGPNSDERLPHMESYAVTIESESGAVAVSPHDFKQFRGSVAIPSHAAEQVAKSCSLLIDHFPGSSKVEDDVLSRASIGRNPWIPIANSPVKGHYRSGTNSLLRNIDPLDQTAHP